MPDNSTGIYASFKVGDYTAVAADNNAVHRFTANTTLTLAAAAALGADWHYKVIADGGDVVVNPDGSETINGAATLIVPNGTSTFIICSGSAFFTDKDEVKAAPDYVSGLVPNPNTVTPLFYIDISAGRAFFAGKSVSFGTTFTKRMNAPWATGSNAGAIDTGPLAPSTTFHIYILRQLANPSIGDFIASQSNSSAGVTVPAGWEVLPNSRIGSFLVLASGNILTFKQTGNRVQLMQGFTEISGSNFNNIYNPVGLPNDISVDGLFAVNTSVGANSSAAFWGDTIEPTIQNNIGALLLFVNTAASAMNSAVAGIIRSTAAGTIWARASVLIGTGSTTLTSVGWIDYTVSRIGG
ncbi:hypothetical protein [Rhizobium leguminosarum]|uniref:hypothetical protein n=1 Tax=Rhizobium leguminosarum TaxID=384 RepID=UPI001C96AAE0|nr:hypothetical protein [Rhizobium leguminosarum]MBY5796446.1 hypothetical protein [Rhizobium leguminosarum]